MLDEPGSLPEDPEELRAFTARLLTEVKAQAILIEKLRHQLAGHRAHRFGASSESADQLQLALETSEIAATAMTATLRLPEIEPKDKPKRRPIPDHVPRMRRERATGSSAAPNTERLDIVPAQFRVIVTIRPKYACRTCTNGVTQAPAPAHLIEGALRTEAMIAHVLVAKYADHCPLYRQAQVYVRAGLALDRSTLAGWMGRAAFHLKPVVDRLAEHLKGSGKLFMDETPAPVLDPGRGKTRTGYLWALARDDRPWGGTDPPGVVYFHAPGRGGGHAEAILAVQAAVAGQGVVLGSLPNLRNLVAANLLVTPISERVATDIGYDLMTTERALARSAVAAFVDWIIEQARAE